MRRLAVRPLAILAILSVLVGLAPMGSGAQEATPAAAAPPGVLNLFLIDFCSQEEIAKGSQTIVEQPSGAALVRPAATPDRDLYLLMVTVPPGACLGYDGHYLHDGAITWFVQAGEIDFATRPIVGRPTAVVNARHKDGSPFALTGEFTRLVAGDWVSIDRAAHYSYRNAGDADAIVLMAVYETTPVFEEPMIVFACGEGGCRGRGKS